MHMLALCGVCSKCGYRLRFVPHACFSFLLFIHFCDELPTCLAECKSTKMHQNWGYIPFKKKKLGLHWEPLYIYSMLDPQGHGYTVFLNGQLPAPYSMERSSYPTIISWSMSSTAIFFSLSLKKKKLFFHLTLCSCCPLSIKKERKGVMTYGTYHLIILLAGRKTLQSLLYIKKWHAEGTHVRYLILPFLLLLCKQRLSSLWRVSLITY